MQHHKQYILMKFRHKRNKSSLPIYNIIEIADRKASSVRGLGYIIAMCVIIEKSMSIFKSNLRHNLARLDLAFAIQESRSKPLLETIVKLASFCR